MSGTIEPPCGVPAHRMGWWDDEVLGIWWCPDCHEEIWVTEEADDDAEAVGVGSTPAGAEDARRGGAADVPVVRDPAADRGDAAGASGDRASAGWRDEPGGARLWHLIVEAFGRAAS